MKTFDKILMDILLMASFVFYSYGQISKTGNSSSSSYGGHEYVDLGLPSGTLWATCNVGASNPEDYGSYFSWGETTTKNTYNWSTYKYCKGAEDNLTKYCSHSVDGYNGFTDNLTILLNGDDAASVNWGNGWRTPTGAELEELYKNTTNTWTTQNGVNGRLFTARNGKSLFLPAAGRVCGNELDYSGRCGDYWSSSLSFPPSRTRRFHFSPDDCGIYYFDRQCGLSVRPVRSKSNENVRTSTDAKETSTNTTSPKNISSKTNTNPTTIQTQTATEGEIYQIVEQMPTFPGGDKALSEFISINIRYPQAALDKGVQGRVFVSFVVEPDGSLSDVKATRGIGSGCDEEAVRVVKSMPKWEPGKQGGQAVRVSYNLPVNFKLPK